MEYKIKIQRNTEDELEFDITSPSYEDGGVCTTNRFDIAAELALDMIKEDRKNKGLDK